MPIFEYRCRSCGHEQEHFHRRRDESAPPCARCGCTELERTVSLTSFQLKGGGWYVSDYKGHCANDATSVPGKASEAASEGSSPAAGESPSPSPTAAASADSSTSSAEKAA